MAITLDRALLERFDAALGAFGAPIVDAWAPGLSDEEIDALLLPLGIDLPQEARVWWGWHDGTREDAPILSRHFGRRAPLGLRDVSEIYASLRGADEQLWGLKGLLSPITDKPDVYFGCAGARYEHVPIYTQNDIETPAIVLPSIGELVLAWITLIEQGAWSINPDGIWELNEENVPPGLAELLII